MNEIIFIASIFAVSTASLIALSLGKEGLIALISVQAVLVNLFVMKQITLGGFTATAADSLAVGTTLGFNLLQEYYQKPIAKRAIWISFFCAVFYSIMGLLHIAYTPCITDSCSEAYQILLSPMPRIVGASLISYVITQTTDTTLYGMLRTALNGRYFILRNYATLSFTQLLDTVLFSFLGLYKLNESFSSLTTLFDIILVSFIIKMVVIIIAVPYVKIVKRFIHPPL